MVVSIWHGANIKTIKPESVAIRIERRFAGWALPNAISKQTFTGEHRNNPDVAPEVAEERAITRGSEKAEAEDATEIAGPRKWAGSRKRKYETKKSLKAKQLLPTLFDIGIADDYQDAEALVYLRDARAERKLLLPVERAGVPEKVEVTETGEEGENVEEAKNKRKTENPFKSIGK